MWLSGHISARGSKKRKAQSLMGRAWKNATCGAGGQEFLHLTVALTKVYLLPTPGLEKSYGSPKATPYLEQDLVLDWLVAPHHGSSRLMRSSLISLTRGLALVARSTGW